MNSKGFISHLSESPTPPSPIGPQRVLLVDDERIIVDLLHRALPRQNFVCDIAQSFDQAANQLAVESYDVVVTDLNMPGQNGLQLVQHIARHYPTTAVLMLTG